MSNKHQHIFAEDMSDEMCQFALETSQEAFQLTISKGQVSCSSLDFNSRRM